MVLGGLFSLDAQVLSLSLFCYCFFVYVSVYENKEVNVNSRFKSILKNLGVLEDCLLIAAVLLLLEMKVIPNMCRLDVWRL